MGCAPLSDVKQRDLQIKELKKQKMMDDEKMLRDAMIIDSLKSCAEDLRLEKSRYKSVSDYRDQLFSDFSACNRELDTLYMKKFEIEEELEKCRK